MSSQKRKGKPIHLFGNSESRHQDHGSVQHSLLASSYLMARMFSRMSTPSRSQGRCTNILPKTIVGRSMPLRKQRLLHIGFDASIVAFLLDLNARRLPVVSQRASSNNANFNIHRHSEPDSLCIRVFRSLMCRHYKSRIALNQVLLY